MSLAPFYQAKLNQMRNDHGTESLGKTDEEKGVNNTEEPFHHQLLGCRGMYSRLEMHVN